MKLVNVRLSDEDAALVADLRREGLELSTVVRDAVRARHLALRPALDRAGVRKMLQSLYERHPLHEDEERLEVDATDRSAVRKLVRARLARPRR